MKYIFGFLVTILLIILLIILLVTGGGSKSQAPNSSKTLSTYSDDASALVRLTVDGPIVAPQNHRATRITVSRDSTTFEQLVGYNGQVTLTQTYGNTQTSYLSFLRALQLAGFTKGDKSTDLKNDRGYCALGSRYIFELEASNKRLERFWSTSCGETRSFDGNTPLNLTLFRNQVPDYNKLINRSDSSTN